MKYLNDPHVDVFNHKYHPVCVLKMRLTHSILFLWSYY